MISTVPKGWEKRRFRDLATVEGGFAFQGSDFTTLSEDTVPIIRMSNLKSGKIDLSEAIFIRKDKVKDLDKFRLRKGDFIFGMSGSISNFSIIKEQDGICYQNQRIGRLNPINSVRDFVSQLFLSENITNKVREIAAGGAQLNISPSQIENIEVLSPPFHEQKKIAAILTSVDEVIENTQKQIDKLQDLKKATMNELLTKGIGHTEFKDSPPLGPIPKSWEVKTLGEISKVKRGASPRPIQSPKWWGGTVGWVRISDVTVSDKYLTRTTDYLSKAGVKKSVQIPTGEVIVSICATIGRPIIVSTDVCIHDGFVWFKNMSTDINREFLYYFMSSIEDRLSSQKQTGTQGNLNTNIVSQVIFPLPPQPEQQKIASMLALIDEHIKIRKQKYSIVSSIKKALMQDLLTGKVRVNTLKG